MLGAVTKGSPVICETVLATFSAKPTRVLRPVPTAVPPAASMYSLKGKNVFTTLFHYLRNCIGVKVSTVIDNLHYVFGKTFCMYLGSVASILSMPNLS